MEIELSKLKGLILAMEPDTVTQSILQMNNWGKASSFGSTFSVEYFWDWNKERIRAADEHDIDNLIKDIVWT